MAKNWREIYIKDILNLYDYNRDGEKPIYLVEDDDRSILLDSSCIAIDLMSDMQVSGRFPEFRPLKGSDVVSKEYYGLVPVNLYSGITRLEKATGVKSYAKLDYQEKKCTGERALVVGGILFTQLGTATLEKHTYR